jgi:hypothetical protein
METKLILWTTGCMAFMLSFMYAMVTIISNFVN